jgi:hypothetical protein
MTWLVARGAESWLRCGRCRAPIGAGEPYALVTSAGLKRCLACVRAVFGVEPPAAIWASRPPTDDDLPPPITEALERLAVAAGR